jgi:hypothetical protein
MTTMGEAQKAAALARTAQLLGLDGELSRQLLDQLWDQAFEEGRLAALDNLQDQFYVCVKCVDWWPRYPQGS